MAADSCKPPSQIGEAVTMKIYITLFFLFTLLPASLYGAAVTDQSFTLFYSNDVRGETEPCG